ncbi:MAG: PIG-L family deacetylase [Pseudohongiellaceae bacterium]
MIRSAKLLLLPVSLLSFALTAPAWSQVDAIYDQGNNALVRLLGRLQTTASVLHTGAHPDDEDSALVAYHARGLNARTAYLSLTRGSGGQNIIGAEQSDALGIIRTEELLQARRLDGAQQFFTRANDFGFSKYGSEASRVWPENEILEDMVRSIRAFRPDVVVSRWNGSPSDGHGHHQFSGYLTPLAVKAAADPARFPSQLAEGLQTWQVQRLFLGSRSNSGVAEGRGLSINTGQYDPIAGKSFFEIGMQGRSQQKTQQMGSLELLGDQHSFLQLSETSFDVSNVQDSVLDGIDTAISGLIRYESSPSADFIDLIENLESVNRSLLENFDAFAPSALLDDLAQGYELAKAARELAQAADTRRLLDEKLAEFEAAMVLAAGVRIDALIESETLVPGSVTKVAVRLFNLDSSRVSFRSSHVNGPTTWVVSQIEQQQLANEIGRRRQDSADHESNFLIEVPTNYPSTQPYWLESPRESAAYDWEDAGDAKTLAFAIPLLNAGVILEIAGIEIEVVREVQFRELNRIRGEVRRRIDVVPKLSVEPATDLAVIPVSDSSKPIELLLTVRNNSNENVNGSAQFSLPHGWTLEPSFSEFALEPAPATATLSFKITLPDDLEAGEYRLVASARTGSDVYQQSMQKIAYPHISSHRAYSEAATEIEVVDVTVADVNVGYIMGSGDLVPDSLRRLGVNVDLLSDSEITTGDLSHYDVIVVGIRASQTRSAFVASNQRLLNYAEQGGTLIVQYQQPDFAQQNLAPFQVSMEKNIRVVDETAAVTILEPDHPVFSFPNRITAEDFEGWVQERSNYNFTSFDSEHYVPLTEAHDEGEAASEGAMLYAPLGEGHYIYTAYSWFRQLPNGVAGAYRLFANMLSLSEAPK